MKKLLIATLLLLSFNCYSQDIIRPDQAMSLAWDELLPLLGSQTFVNLSGDFTADQLPGFKTSFELANPGKKLKTLTITHYYDTTGGRWLKFGYVIYHEETR